MPTLDQNPDLPQPQGLYHPGNEHDACGVNFVADLKGRASHDIVAAAIGAPEARVRAWVAGVLEPRDSLSLTTLYGSTLPVIAKKDL